MASQHSSEGGLDVRAKLNDLEGLVHLLMSERTQLMTKSPPTEQRLMQPTQQAQVEAGQILPKVA